VLKAVREQLKEQPLTTDDRDLIERHVKRVVVKPEAIEVRLAESKDQADTTDECQSDGMDRDRSDHRTFTIALLWAAASFSAVNGILHAPEPSPILQTEMRDALLMAIAKARLDQ
jgi:hypothetical protein